MQFMLRCAKSLQSCPALCDPMDCSPPGSLFVGFSRQEYWSGLPLPPPGDLPQPGIKPSSLMSPALAGGFFTTTATWEAPHVIYSYLELSCVFICSLVNCPSLHVNFTRSATTAAAKSLQSCPTLCDPVPGVLQARTLAWAAISFSRA